MAMEHGSECQWRNTPPGTRTLVLQLRVVSNRERVAAEEDDG